jgi:hypothetical protein
MLSQLPGIYFLLGGALSNVSSLIDSIINNNFLLGAIFSSVSLLISNCINNNFQLNREKEQRIWQEKNEKQKWKREKVYDSYRTSIHALTKIIQLQTDIASHGITPDKVTNINNLYAEFSTEFYIMIISHPNRNSEKFKEKTDLILDIFEDEPITARFEMIEIMENDPRIKNVEEEDLNGKKFSTQSN